MKQLIIMAVLFLIIVQPACQDTSVSQSEPEVRFSINTIQGTPQNSMLFKSIADAALNEAKAASPKDISEYNMARIMVFDLSAFESWEEYQETGEWNDFEGSRDRFWEREGGGGQVFSWASWRKFLGDYFTIVSDQLLSMDADSAKGTVAGVVGLNHVVVSLTDGDYMEYVGEGNVIGLPNQTAVVDIYMSWFD